MKKYLKQILILVCLISVLILPYFVFASTADSVIGIMDNVAGGSYETSGVTEYTFAEKLGLIVKVFLGLLGVIFIILIILAGFKYMTAQGDEGKVKESLASIRHAVIGLIIVVGAYAIWYFLQGVL